MDPELALRLPSAGLVLPLCVPSGSPACSTADRQCGCHSCRLALPRACPTPPSSFTQLFCSQHGGSRRWNAFVSSRSPSAELFRELIGLDILRHNFLCSPMVLLRQLDVYMRHPTASKGAHNVSLKVIRSSWPSALSALPGTVPAATICSFDPAAHLRRRCVKRCK